MIFNILNIYNSYLLLELHIINTQNNYMNIIKKTDIKKFLNYIEKNKKIFE